MKQKYIAHGVFKVEEKSLWKFKNELMIEFFYNFCSFILLNTINILGWNREDWRSVHYRNKLPNSIISPEIQTIRGQDSVDAGAWSLW